jgi:hypothetical protein
VGYFQSKRLAAQDRAQLSARGGHLPLIEHQEQMERLTPETLGLWYLRLNGFLTIPNFVVHPDSGHDVGTDVDVLGVRFPYREENVSRPMMDSPRFTKVGRKAFVAITEVKRSLCSLNGPWTDRHRGNMPRLLNAVGLFSRSETEAAAEALYNVGVYDNTLYHVSLLCLGERENPEIARDHPRVPQITWDEVLNFVFQRFDTYHNQKRAHQTWDAAGRRLWSLFDQPGGDRSERRHRFHERVLNDMRAN